MSYVRLRRFWVAAHLYLGLLLGGFLVLLGVTGSLLVFYLEIDRSINPAISVQPGRANPPSLEAVLRKLQSDFPDKPSGWRIELPLSHSQPIMARYMNPKEKALVHFAPLVVTLDPCTLQITSARFWGDFAMTWIYDLHYTLLLDDVGKTIQAGVSILAFVSIFSGLYLWWPKNGNFKAALVIRKNAHFVRRIYDWHKIAGLSGFVFIFMLTLTGLMLEKPHWFDSALAWTSPLRQTDHYQSQPGHYPRLGMDDIAGIVGKQFPHAELRWVYTPEDSLGVYQVRMYQKIEPGRRFPKTTIWLDQYTGKVLAVRDAGKDAIGDQILAWLHPLHNGEAFGLAGRWLVFFSGLLPLILFVSGFIRWRCKRRAVMVGNQRRDKIVVNVKFPE